MRIMSSDGIVLATIVFVAVLAKTGSCVKLIEPVVGSKSSIGKEVLLANLDIPFNNEGRAYRQIRENGGIMNYHASDAEFVSHQLERTRFSFLTEVVNGLTVHRLIEQNVAPELNECNKKHFTRRAKMMERAKDNNGIRTYLAHLILLAVERCASLTSETIEKGDDSNQEWLRSLIDAAKTVNKKNAYESVGEIIVPLLGEKRVE